MLMRIQLNETSLIRVAERNGMKERADETKRQWNETMEQHGTKHTSLKQPPKK